MKGTELDAKMLHQIELQYFVRNIYLVIPRSHGQKMTFEEFLNRHAEYLAKMYIECLVPLEKPEV